MLPLKLYRKLKSPLHLFPITLRKTAKGRDARLSSSAEIHSDERGVGKSSFGPILQRVIERRNLLVQLAGDDGEQQVVAFGVIVVR
jgi:hypothetical protein